MKTNNLKTLPYLPIGIAMIILSNPLLYMSLAAIAIDVQNLFGASIDRSTAGFDTSSPFIQAMSFVTILGLLMILAGRLLRKK